MKALYWIKSNLILLALVPGAISLSSYTAGYAVKAKEEEQEEVINRYEAITEHLVSTIQQSDSLYEVLRNECKGHPCDSTFKRLDAIQLPCKQVDCLPVPCIPDTITKYDTVFKLKDHFLFAK